MMEITEEQLRDLKYMAKVRLSDNGNDFWSGYILNLVREIECASAERESAEARQTSPEG